MKIYFVIIMMLCSQLSMANGTDYAMDEKKLSNQKNTGTSYIDDKYLDEGPVRAKIQREEEQAENTETILKHDPYIDNGNGSMTNPKLQENE